MGENRTWERCLLVRRSYHDAMRARKFACPEGGFWCLGTTCLLIASRTNFEVLIVNVFFCEVLAVQILRCALSRALLAFNNFFHALLFDFCVISIAPNLNYV